MNEIFSLAIVGSAVSIILEVAKYFTDKYSQSTSVKIGSLIALSLVASLFYTLFKETHYWETFLKVLVTANAIYTMLIKQAVNWSKTV